MVLEILGDIHNGKLKYIEFYSYILGLYKTVLHHDHPEFTGISDMWFEVPERYGAEWY